MFSPESNSVIRKWTREMQPILDERISPSHLLSIFVRNSGSREYYHPIRHSQNLVQCWLEQGLTTARRLCAVCFPHGYSKS